MQRNRNWSVCSGCRRTGVSDSEWRYHWHQWGWHNSVHRYIIRAVQDLDKLISRSVYSSCKYFYQGVYYYVRSCEYVVRKRNTYVDECYIQHILDSLASKEEALLDGRGVLERGI